MPQSYLMPLVLKTASGDGEAYEQLILSQKNNIAFAIRRITDCPEDVEDISQNVAILVYQGIGSLKRPEAFPSWLRTLVVRESLRIIKARIQAEPLEPGDDLDIRFAETDMDCLPTMYAELLELRADIRSALARMPETLSKVLTLHYLRGMCCREIADFLDTTIGAVSAYLFRARKRMKMEMARF